MKRSKSLHTQRNKSTKTSPLATLSETPMFCSTRKVHQISALRHGAMSCRKIRRIGGADPERVAPRRVGAREVEEGPTFRAVFPLSRSKFFHWITEYDDIQFDWRLSLIFTLTCPKMKHSGPFFLRPPAPPKNEVSKYTPTLQNHGPHPESNPFLFICASTLVVFKLPQKEL